MGNIDGIKVINICDVIHYDTPWEESKAVLEALCKDTGFAYYGRPREDFSVWEAVSIAKAAGNPGVVVEDLS